MSSVFGLEATGKENNRIQVQVSYINPSNIALGFLASNHLPPSVMRIIQL